MMFSLKCVKRFSKFKDQAVFCNASIRKWNFSTAIPDEYYDPDKEIVKEHEDMTTAINKGGLNKLTILKNNDKESSTISRHNSKDILRALKKISREQIKGLSAEANAGLASSNLTSDCSGNELMSYSRDHMQAAADLDTLDWLNGNSRTDSAHVADEGWDIEDQSEKFQKEVGPMFNPDIAEHVESFETESMIPPEMLNYNIPWRTTEEFPDKVLDRFIPKTSHQKFNYDQQGLRHCPGKLQRRGMNPQFGCHLIDLDALNFLDVMTLRNFITEDSEIMPRKSTGLCAKCQRKVAKTIKRSRNFGLMPHLGEFVIQDGRPGHGGKHLHDTVGGAARMKSSSIL